MERVEIEEVVRQEIMAAAGIKLSAIHMDSRLMEDLGMDSLDRVEFMLALEEELDIEMTEEESDKLDTVQEVVDYLVGRVK